MLATTYPQYSNQSPPSLVIINSLIDNPHLPQLSTNSSLNRISDIVKIDTLPNYNSIALSYQLYYITIICIRLNTCSSYY
jgi:hypothetical protein